MKWVIVFAALATGWVGAAVAAPIPLTLAQMAPEARAEALDAEFTRLRLADKHMTALEAEREIWRLWFIGADEDQTTRLNDASERMRLGASVEAIPMLEALVAEHPDFTEAWNQLAFARFLTGDLEGSLEDIAEVLKREPRHFGALAGRARIEVAQGRPQRAMRTMGEVGAIHPWMARVSPIQPIPAPPPPAEGQDL